MTRKWTAGIGVLLTAALVLGMFTGCGEAKQREEAMQQQIDLLQSYIEVNMRADLENWDGSYVGVGVNTHDIYDDTAVLEAYKTGDESGLSEEDIYTLHAAKDVLAELAITENMSEFEKEKAVYDWQVAYARYDVTRQAVMPPDIDHYNYYPYGVLKYHSAICVGNATTFKLFMDMLGIDCKIIHSTAQGEHAWNLVKIDGDWYHVDVTFDGSSNTGEPAYNLFNVPDSVKQTGSYPWSSEQFPAATATKYCMAVMQHQELADLYALPQAVKEALKDGKQNVYVSFADGSTLSYADNPLDLISGYLEKFYLHIGQTYSLEDGTVVQGIRIEPWGEPEDAVELYDHDRMRRETDRIFQGHIEYLG